MRVGHVGRVIAFGMLFAASYAVATPLTPGNLAIYRYGDGSENLGSGNAVSAYIDEYKTDGTFVQSFPLPTTGASALTAVGTGTIRDGIIQRSQDGHSIVFGGFRANQGDPNPITSVAPKAIGVLYPNGSTNTSTSFTNVLNNVPIRSVGSLDGTSFYASGDTANSVAYIPFGTGATGVAVQAGNWRAVHVENNKLYAMSGSTGFRGISTVGSGLPTTTGQSFTVITNENNPNAGSPGVSSMDVADDNINIIYAAGSAVLTADDFRRYVFNGTTSLYAGAVALPTQTVLAAPGGSAYGVFAVPDGLGGETVYMTTKSSLYKVVDSSPLSTNFASLALVHLADAPAGTEFRGLTGTPVPVPEPASLALASLAIAGLFAARRLRNKQS